MLQNKITVMQGELSLKNEAFSRVEIALNKQVRVNKELEDENQSLKQTLKWLTVESERMMTSLFQTQQ